MTLVLGVDGGNTKTVALVARADGTVVGAGRAGCADLYGAASPEAALDAVAGAASEALAAAGATGADLSGAVFCLAGADWPEDFELHRHELTERLALRWPPTIFNDAIATLRAGTPDAVGVAAVVGTGGAIAGRNAQGDTWHLGFWPDGMAAGGIARAGLRAVYRNGLGLDVPTTLTERACALYGVPAGDVMELLHRFSRRGPKPAAVAMVPIVFEEAVAGDAVARAIIETDASRFADAVRTTASHLGLAAPYALVLAGGVLRHPAAALHADAIAHGVPDAIAVRATWEPAAGAVLLACDEAGFDPCRARLRETLPAQSFFATRSDP
jgi:N-acetylglucosamine kinase-like BadF-type ATPase